MSIDANIWSDIFKLAIFITALIVIGVSWKETKES